MKPGLRAALFIATISIAAPAAAQHPDAGVQTQLAEMKKLDFLVGQWRGNSWMQMGPNRSTSQVFERIERRLDGMALVIEGLGKAKDAEGNERVVHNALAMVNYDPAAKRYRFMSQTTQGYFTNAEARFEDGAFIWGYKSPIGEFRFTIRLNEKGQWFEIGEVSRDSQPWQKFFEMTLDRVQ